MLSTYVVFHQFCSVNDNASIMEDLTKKNKQVVKDYKRPALNYKQIVEIIDRRISEIEKASDEFSKRNKQKNKPDKK